jgi:hypothetical protein
VDEDRFAVFAYAVFAVARPLKPNALPFLEEVRVGPEFDGPVAHAVTHAQLVLREVCAVVPSRQTAAIATSVKLLQAAASGSAPASAIARRRSREARRP